MSHNILLELKNEYTIYLVELITPCIFEGLTQIYQDACIMSKNKDIENGENRTLEIFQSLLNVIPRWKDTMLKEETNRIIKKINIDNVFEKLLKAVVKSYIMILTYNQNIINVNNDLNEFYDNISMSKFIHNCYIQCAIQFFNYPFYFYHKNADIRVKKNQREIISIIKECIQISIRKILPLDIILSEFLSNKLNMFNINIPHVELLSNHQLEGGNPTIATLKTELNTNVSENDNISNVNSINVENVINYQDKIENIVIEKNPKNTLSIKNKKNHSISNSDKNNSNDNNSSDKNAHVNHSTINKITETKQMNDYETKQINDTETSILNVDYKNVIHTYKNI